MAQKCWVIWRRTVSAHAASPTKMTKHKQPLLTVVLEVRVRCQDDACFDRQSHQNHLDGPVDKVDVRVRQLSTDGSQSGTNTTSVRERVSIVDDINSN